MTRSLEGRRVLITGASGALGGAVAKRLVDDGATLVVVSRNESALRNLVASLPRSGHVTMSFDVRSEASWRRFAPAVAPDGQLAGIVTAAAALAPIGPAGTWDLASFRSTIDVNLVGTLLPVLMFLEELKAACGSVVTFSGGGATAPLPRFAAYAASKAAVVRLTENLAEELRQDGVRLNSVAPGFVVSALHDATLAAGPGLAGDCYYRRTRSAVSEGADSPDLAADLVSFLLSDAAVGITGKLISARWDPWRDPTFRRRLREDPSIATIRRIDDQYFTSVRR